MTDPSPGLDLRTGTQRTFLHVLLSTLVVSVINFTVWFAVTSGSTSRPGRSSPPA